MLFSSFGRNATVTDLKQSKVRQFFVQYFRVEGFLCNMTSDKLKGAKKRKTGEAMMFIVVKKISYKRN